MSRSGYTTDYSTWHAICWRGAVASAIRGKRGQAMLRELLLALDALSEKRLIAHDLITDDGSCCTLGALGKSRGLDMVELNLDNDMPEEIGKFFGIPRALAAEIEYENDEGGLRCPQQETPEARWHRMRAWVVANISRGHDS